MGIDNLNVVRSIGRPLVADCLAKPLPLVKDADLVALVQNMIRTRGRYAVRVTEVMGHAKDDDVQHGRVRKLTHKVMLKLILLPIFVNVINLKS